MYRLSIELENLGEKEILWEHEPQANVSTAFSRSFQRLSCRVRVFEIDDNFVAGFHMKSIKKFKLQN